MAASQTNPSRRGLPPALAERSRAIVLVHGAWVGEWCWQPVLDPLRMSGRAVHTVSLAGLGTRRHESANTITLADHENDVVNFVLTSDLVDITLVGHSYAGRVITTAFDRLRDRVAALVYVDAHAPIARDNGPSPERRAIAAANDGMVPFGDYDLDPAIFGGEAGIAWFRERLMPQSYLTFDWPWQTDLGSAVRKTYVYCSGNAPSVFGQYAEVARTNPEWRYVELDAPHFVMFSHPRELSDIILGS